jgi:hypothetical protein
MCQTLTLSWASSLYEDRAKYSFWNIFWEIKGQREKLSEIKSTLVGIALLGQVYTFFLYFLWIYEYTRKYHVMYLFYAFWKRACPAITNKSNSALFIQGRGMCPISDPALWSKREATKHGQKGFAGLGEQGGLGGQLPLSFLGPPGKSPPPSPSFCPR